MTDQDTFWAVSDVHLHPSRPDVFERFRQFLRKACRHTSTLVILGDLFDYWIGPYEEHREDFEPVFSALRNARNSGLQISFVGGNRDFLAARDLSRQLQVTTHRTRWTHEQDGTTWMGVHGDTLCHHDTSYQLYRRLFQREYVGTLIQSFPSSVKQNIIRMLRGTSEQKIDQFDGKRSKLSSYRIRALLREDVRHLIFGHVHDPGRIDLEVDQTTKTLWILGDWLQPEDCVFFVANPDQSRLVRLEDV